MNERNITVLTDGERMLFAGICGLSKRDSTRTVTITQEQLREATEGHKNAVQRLLSLRYKKIINVLSSTDMNIFSSVENRKDRDDVVFRLTEEFYEELMNTSYADIEAYMSLTGKYPKSLYRILKRYERAGYYSIDLEDFNVLMGVSKGYDTKELTRIVVRPSVNKLKRMMKFTDLKFYYGTERGKATKIIFEWKYFD